MIIGVCGLIGSGKGTVGDILADDYGFVKISFADKLKDIVSTMFDWERDLLEGATDHSRQWRETIDDFWSKELGKTITPRLILQLFGTEVMRQGFHNDIWVISVKKQILDNPNKNYVICDVRFPNEISMIQELSGEVWWVRRGQLPDWFVDYRSNNIIPHNVHPSEWQWARSRFDQEIRNEQSLEDLRSLVKDLLASI